MKPEELESVAALRIALRRFLAATEDVTTTHGLTPRQYDLLALLHRPGGNALTATEIAEQLALSRSAVTELLSRAAEAGLLMREPAEDDMRVKHLSPTLEGSRRFAAAVSDLRGERKNLLSLLQAVAILAGAVTSSF